MECTLLSDGRPLSPRFKKLQETPRCSKGLSISDLEHPKHAFPSHHISGFYHLDDVSYG